MHTFSCFHSYQRENWMPQEINHFWSRKYSNRNNLVFCQLYSVGTWWFQELILWAIEWSCNLMAYESVSLWFQNIYDSLSPWSSKSISMGLCTGIPWSVYPSQINFHCVLFYSVFPNPWLRNIKVDFLSSCLNPICLLLTPSLKIE